MYLYRVSNRSWFQKHRAFFLDRDKVAHVRVTPLLKILVSIDAADDTGHGPTSANPNPPSVAHLDLSQLRGAQGATSPFTSSHWGEHPRPTSRPARCPRMRVWWAGAAQTPRSATRVSVNLHQATAGQGCYSNSMSSTTVRSVHYTCDPYSVFLAWHGDSSPQKGQTSGRAR